MHTQSYNIVGVLFIALLNIVLVGNSSGLAPSVNISKNIILSPETRMIRIGEIREILLTSRAEGYNLQFGWTLDGPGKFKGEDTTQPVIVYIPPEKIDGESAKVTITVAVVDENQEEVRDTIMFTLLAPTVDILPIGPASAPYPPHIRRVSLKKDNEEGTFFPATYLVPFGQVIKITVELVNPSDHDVKIEPRAVVGNAYWLQGNEFIYIAPKGGTSGDMVTVDVIDQETHELVDQKVINISFTEESP